MATQDPRTIVKIGSRTWASEVAIADAGEIAKPHDAAYKFSNGKEFVNKANYTPANPEAADNPPDA